MTYEEKSEIVIRQLREDRDRLQNNIKQIRAEIDGIEISGQIDEHTSFIRTADSVKKIALNIIDKYREERTDAT